MKCKKCSGDMKHATAHMNSCDTVSTAPVEAPTSPTPAIPQEVLDFMKNQTETIEALHAQLTKTQNEKLPQAYVRLSQHALNTKYFEIIKERGQRIRVLRQRDDQLEALVVTDDWQPEMDIERSQIQEQLAQLDVDQRKQSFIPPKEEVQVPDSFRDLIEQSIGGILYIAMENDAVNGIFALYFVPALDPSVRVVRAYHSEGVMRIKEGLEKVRKYLLTINNNKLPTYQSAANIELPQLEISGAKISKSTSNTLDAEGNIAKSDRAWIGSDSL